ncbi:MAG: biopolymer transporter ExbD [Betaproteobacteria bacterium]|nr:biopolymer transporter ExbD [Betaproteobacteria bacterium]
MSGLSRGDRAPSALGSAPGSESERGEFISDINVTPFVDVMLVMLVIFMVTTPALLPLLKLDLPGTQAGATLERQQTGDVNHLLFELAADGSMRLNREPVEREALLAERFAQAAAQRPQPELQLRIDASVSYAQISRVFLLAQEQGLSSMSLVMDQGAAAASTASRTKP